MMAAIFYEAAAMAAHRFGLFSAAAISHTKLTANSFGFGEASF
ncbi:hypothetical protein PO124_28365 [Bacillus licheniformis]|nr:hypothetical protein [Bacillus licheniformis]